MSNIKIRIRKLEVSIPTLPTIPTSQSIFLSKNNTALFLSVWGVMSGVKYSDKDCQQHYLTTRYSLLWIAITKRMTFHVSQLRNRTATTL